MITIFVKTYNSKLVIPFFIDFYRKRFPDCSIVVYDNQSEDGTADLAKKLGCEVRLYDTKGMINPYAGRKIKNNCWKDAPAEWVLVCDADEMLDIDQERLKMEQDSGTTIISTEGYQMVNMEDGLDLSRIRHGFRDASFDKTLMFNRKKISDINYDLGCHSANPKGKVKYSNTKYRIYHYHFLNPEHMASGYRQASGRLSRECIREGLCSHYLQNDDDHIKTTFELARKSSTELF